MKRFGKETKKKMMNEENKLVKPSPPSETQGIQKAGATVKITGKSRLHSALAGAPKEDPTESFKKAAQAAGANAGSADAQRDPLTAINRIAIMADCSGSMSETTSGARKIEHLKNALNGFINQVNFDTTSVGIFTFPTYSDHDVYHPRDFDEDVDLLGTNIKAAHRLSFDRALLEITAASLRSSGGTPMHSTMSEVLTKVPLTRGIIISDGDADRYDAAITEANGFAKSETIVDTVHIGDSTSGESLLQEIARITGGIYIKFDNVANFAKAFSFLTPEGRATLRLTGGNTLEEKEAVAKLLGAKEVK